MNAPINGHSINGQPFEAPTDHSARMMFDGALDDVRRAEPGETREDAFRYAAALGASLCDQGWIDLDDAQRQLARVGVLLETPDSGPAQAEGIIIGAFADLMPPAEAEFDCRALARRHVATAPDKVTAFLDVATDLAGGIAAGECSRVEAADTLQNIAEVHGLVDRLGQDRVMEIIAGGLQGAAPADTLAGPLRFFTENDNADLDRKTAEIDASDAAPLPLVQQLAPAEPYPVDALGPALGAAALGIANKIQVPIELSAQSVLAVASLAAQALADVQLPFGQRRPLSAFFMSIASSGDRKTATDHEALRPVHMRERTLQERYDDEMKAWRVHAAAWQGEKRSIEGKKSLNFESRRAALRDLGPEPLAPLHPFLTAPEPTIEGLAHAWVRAPASLGLFSAEGGQFTGGHGMSQEHRLKTAASLSTLWDGGTLRRLRAGSGVTMLPGRRLAFHVMVQPGVAVPFLCDPLLRDQGLLSRVLLAAPISLQGSRSFKAPNPNDEQAIRRYTGVIIGLLERQWPLADGKDNELRPPVLHLSEAATAAWREFHDETESQQGPQGRLLAVRDFASKAAEHATRLAGILAIVDNPQASEISAESMARGVSLARWYVGEALRLAASAMLDPAVAQAARLLEWWLERPEFRDMLPLRAVMNRGPNSLRDKKAAEAALAILVSHRWARPIGDKGGRWALVSGTEGAATVATTATSQLLGADFVANVAGVAGGQGQKTAFRPNGGGRQ